MREKYIVKGVYWMKIKAILTVPHKNCSLKELEFFLTQKTADIYIFSEGFLDSTTLDDALKIIKKNKKYVIAGFKDLNRNGQHNAIVIDEGEIVSRYTKCILTKGEKEKGKKSGESIFCVETKFGKIGIPICYEIHFPEVARIMSLEKPVLLINIIGTGMYHDLQLEQWTTLAKARAIENEVYVLGCSHFDGEIPLAYAFDPSGKCILLKRGEYGAFVVEIDSDKSNEKLINYFEDREPSLFNAMSE